MLRNPTQAELEGFIGQPNGSKPFDRAAAELARQVQSLKMKGEAKRQFEVEQLEGMDPLEREIAAALMTLVGDDAPLDHEDVWLDEAAIMTLPPIDWLIDGVIQSGGVTVVYGEPGVRKTFILQGAAKAVSRGKRWQNHKTKRGAVLFYETEGLQQLQPRLDAFNSRYGWNPGDGAPFKYVPEPVDLTTPKGIAALIRTGQKVDTLAQKSGDRLRLVVIDPLIENMSGDENNEGMEALSRGLRIIAKKLDCAVLCGHHSNASGERERGSAKLSARVLAMIRLENLPDGAVGLVVEKQRNGPKIAIELVPTVHGDSIVLEWVQEMTAEEYARQGEQRRSAAKEKKQARKTADDSKKGEAILLAAIEKSPGLARDRLLNNCLGEGVGKAALGAALDKLITDGVVREEDGARNARLHYLN